MLLQLLTKRVFVTDLGCCQVWGDGLSGVVEVSVTLPTAVLARAACRLATLVGLGVQHLLNRQD